METNLNLGLCLLINLCQELADTSKIVNTLKILSKNDNEYA